MKHMILAAATFMLMSMTAPAAAKDSADASWRAHGAFAALRVHDVTAMSKWYAEALGFRLVVHDTGRNSALLERQGSILELIQRSEEQKQSAANPAQDLAIAGIIKIGFVVDDFDDLQAALSAHEIPVHGRVITSDVDGLRTLAISDPEGNLIQFFGR